MYATAYSYLAASPLLLFMAKVLYAILMWIVRLTWGILSTIIGLFVFLFFAVTRKIRIHLKSNTIIIYLVPRKNDVLFGFSAGLFIFSNTEVILKNNYLFYHEWGHSWPQLLLMGPLHPFLVLIPSIIRFWWRELQYKKGNTALPAYDSIWFEGTATDWGTKWHQWGEKHELWS